jgi:hypothetical protein
MEIFNDWCNEVASSFLTFKLLFKETSERDEILLRTHDDLKFWKENALCLLVAFDSTKKYKVKIEDLKKFIFVHQNVCWVTYSVEIEYNVIFLYLNNDSIFEGIWSNLLGSGKIKDILIIDSLIRLAKGDDDPIYRQTNEIFHSYNVSVDENSIGKLTQGIDRSPIMIFIMIRL